jgi:phosphonate degradation associated HDIG domain protein
VTPVSTVNDVLELYEQLGDLHYGEGVSMTAHALQCATLAQQADAPEHLVAAALLHDVGHFVVDSRGVAAADDDHHEAVGGRILATLFGPRVAQPVAMHVTAKRWLCSTHHTYAQELSPTSQASLVLQGGPLSKEECGRFERHPGFRDAVLVREWDDQAKQAAMATSSFEDYRALLVRLSLTR